jgi:hypothetical protein
MTTLEASTLLSALNDAAIGVASAIGSRPKSKNDAQIASPKILILLVRLQMVWDNLSCLGTEALAHWS